MTPRQYYTHLLERWKLKTLTANAAEAKGHQKLSLTASENSWCWDNSLALSHNNKPTLTCFLPTALLGIQPKDVKICIHLKHPVDVFDVFINFIHNYEKLKVNNVSFGRINTLICPDNRILFSTNNKWVLKPWNLKCRLLSAKSQSKQMIFCMIPTMWRSTKANLWLPWEYQ